MCNRLLKRNGCEKLALSMIDAMKKKSYTIVEFSAIKSESVLRKKNKHNKKNMIYLEKTSRIYFYRDANSSIVYSVHNIIISGKKKLAQEIMVALQCIDNICSR